MIFERFKLKPQRFVGIDIGTFSLKLVEVSRQNGRIKLENYGEIAAPYPSEKPFRTFKKNTLSLSDREIAKAIQKVIKEAKINTQKVNFSIPDFSSFFTDFELPVMAEEELPKAVEYEARRHIPVPFRDVTLDWQIIDSNSKNKDKSKIKILLVAVPNDVIHQYRAIAETSKLKLEALEAEVFGLMRALIDEEGRQPTVLIDSGARTTTCSIIDEGFLKSSHSFDISGNDLTDVISKSLSIDFQSAEKLKRKYGLLQQQEEEIKKGKEVREILLPLIDIISKEIERVCQAFYQKEGKDVKQIILAGGTALLPGLENYLQDFLKKEVKIADPFSKLIYPPILEKKLKKMGPLFSIAVGMAMSGLK